MTGNKISVYVKDAELFRDIKLLADFDDKSLTDLINDLLRDFAKTRQGDINFLREQANARAARRSAQ